MHDIIFRCDAANIINIGTGHVYRSLAIAKFLEKKFRVKTNKICFAIKSNKKFNAEQILNNTKYKIYKINKYNEYKSLIKIKAKCLIIDSIKKYKLSDIKILKKYFKKIILLDSLNNNKLKFCLRINSLIHKKNCLSGYKYLITPLVNFNKKIKKKNQIFINLGGNNNKKIFEIIKILEDLKKNFRIVLPIFYKNIIAKNLKIKFYNNKNFYKNLAESKISITSGGLVLFDSIFLKTINYCLPLDKYQKRNVINLKTVEKDNIYMVKKLPDLSAYLKNNLINFNDKKRFNVKNMKSVINIIYKYIYND
jgi:spore coat polysaccharide biosynthesis predicted glycosyltransferase SpsG